MSSLERLSLCLAEDEIEALESLRRRLGLQGALLNRSEVIRAAIRHLAGRDEAELLLAVEEVPRFKPGRRAKRDE